MTVEIIKAFGMLVVYPICLFGFFAFLIWMVLRAEEGGYPSGKCLEEARAAIAKATGEKP